MTWLITGASGLLGSALCHHLSSNNSVAVGIVNHHKITIDGALIKQCDITNEIALGELLAEANPTHIIHCAALTNVDQCETNPDLATKLHVTAPANMANWANKNHRKMVYISTDHLWDGTKQYVEETDITHPLNSYAKTKSIGENHVLTEDPNALIARTNFYGEGLEWRASFSD